MSFNLSTEGELLDRELLSIRPSYSLDAALQTKVSDYVEKLRSIIREKNRLIMHLKSKLTEESGEEKEQDTLSDYEDSLSEKGNKRNTRKPPLWHKLETESL